MTELNVLSMSFVTWLPGTASYDPNMQPSFLNTWSSFSNTHIHFQILYLSIDQRTWPSFCFKTHGQAFQTLSGALTELLKPQNKTKSLAECLENLPDWLKRLITCLCYSIAHAVEPTMAVVPMYSYCYCFSIEAYCQ